MGPVGSAAALVKAPTLAAWALLLAAYASTAAFRNAVAKSKFGVCARAAVYLSASRHTERAESRPLRDRCFADCRNVVQLSC